MWVRSTQTLCVPRGAELSETPTRAEGVAAASLCGHAART